MARIPYLNAEDLAPEHRSILELGVREPGGAPMNLYRAMLNSPNCRRAQNEFSRYFRQDSRLDHRLREFAILQVGYSSRQPYEWSHHVKTSQKMGFTEGDIQALIDWNEGRPTKLDELTRMVLQGAREMASDRLAMSDEAYNVLARHLPVDQLIDLIVSIGYYCSTVRILSTLQIDVEENYKVYLERFPLPQS